MSWKDILKNKEEIDRWRKEIEMREKKPKNKSQLYTGDTNLHSKEWYHKQGYKEGHTPVDYREQTGDLSPNYDSKLYHPDGWPKSESLKITEEQDRRKKEEQGD
jgi:hypothetical protein